MSVAVKIDGSSLQRGDPQRVFEMNFGLARFYDVIGSGRFLVSRTVEEDVATPITVLTNWAAILKR